MKAKMGTVNFNRMISAVKQFQGHGLSNKSLNFVRIEFHSMTSEAVAIASDGCRLSVEHAVAESDEDFTIYVDGKTRLPKEKNAIITLEGDEVMIRCDGCIFGYKQPVGEFFDWERAIPDEPKFKIAFNGDYLLSALQAAKASCGGSYHCPIVLEFRSNRDPVVIRTNKNDIKLVLPVVTRE